MKIFDASIRGTSETEFLSLFANSLDLENLFIIRELSQELPEKYEMTSYISENNVLSLILSKEHLKCFEMGAPGVVWAVSGSTATLVYDAKNLRGQMKNKFDLLTGKE